MLGGSKPPPFQRNMISVDREPRKWHYTVWSKLSAGDVVQDKGKIVSIEEKSGEVMASFSSGEEFIEQADKAVFAFTEV